MHANLQDPLHATNASPELTYAPISVRLWACVVDLACCCVLFAIAMFAFVAFQASRPLEKHSYDPSLILFALIAWGYFAGLESSPMRATVGKLGRRLIVTDAKGERISFSRASLRFIAKIAGVATLGATMLPALMDRQSRSLHDFVAQTRVRSLASAQMSQGNNENVKSHAGIGLLFGLVFAFIAGAASVAMSPAPGQRINFDGAATSRAAGFMTVAVAVPNETQPRTISYAEVAKFLSENTGSTLSLRAGEACTPTTPNGDSTCVAAQPLQDGRQVVSVKESLGGDRMTTSVYSVSAGTIVPTSYESVHALESLAPLMIAAVLALIGFVIGRGTGKLVAKAFAKRNQSSVIH
jgi:uncharacterized RDD family membrane protein YckC